MGVPVLGVGGESKGGVWGLWGGHLAVGRCLCANVGNNNQKVLFGFV